MNVFSKNSMCGWGDSKLQGGTVIHLDAAIDSSM